jgi:hypothetical protein
MRTAEFVEVKMRRATLLVIFEYLARSHDEWSKTGQVPGDYSESTLVPSRPDPGGRVALWRLEGEIERTLPEIFDPDDNELIAMEKKRLSEELYGSGRQES